MVPAVPLFLPFFVSSIPTVPSIPTSPYCTFCLSSRSKCGILAFPIFPSPFFTQVNTYLASSREIYFQAEIVPENLKSMLEITQRKEAPFWGVNFSLVRNVRGVKFYDTATAV